MKYRIVEKRSVYVEYIIESESLEKAERLNGEILEEAEIKNYGDELISIEEVED